MSTINLSREDNDLIITLSAAGGCSLATTPQKDNWVDHAGHLPQYICRIARAVKRSGHSTSSAIAIAVGRTKAWAAGAGKVNADTRAKAAAAVAQWEALKAKSHAGKLVKATSIDGDQYVMLSNIPSFNTEIVRRAWNQKEQERREKARQNSGTYVADSTNDETTPALDTDGYTYIRELWTDYILLDVEVDGGLSNVKVPYTVAGDEVTFGDPIEVKQLWVEADQDLTDEEKALLADVLSLSNSAESQLARISALMRR